MRIHYEDFAVGQTFELGSRTLARERMLEFSAEFDPQPFHLDEEAARASIFGGLIASGWHTGAILMGLLATGLLNDTASQGSPGVDELRWPKPVHAGATLTGRATVLQTRVSKSRPNLGLVQIRSELLDDDGDAVVVMTSWGMFGRRPE